MVSAIPAWINSPPDSLPSTPPVLTRDQVLPFGQLSWENFERLALRLIRQTAAVTSCSIYGVQGDSQHGIDILATNHESSSHLYCQCKRVQKFSPTDIKNAVGLFREGPFHATAAEFILCVAIPMESAKQVREIENQRTLLAEDGIRLTVWDASINGTLNERLKAAPELVDDFFGRTWVEAFNGADAARRLGDRLDGRDAGALRSRFDALYTTLFNQHDPGPDSTTGRVSEYAHRYVVVDIYEDVGVEDANEARPRQEPYAVTEAQHAYGRDAQHGDLSVLTSIDAPAPAVTARHRRPALEWLGQQENSLLLGEPGYGKSALLRNLTLGLLRAEAGVTGNLSPDLLRRLPAWLPFAAFANAVTNDPRVSVQDHFEDWLHRYGFDDAIVLFRRAAKAGELILLVDGLDEATSPAAARRAFDRIATFVCATGAAIICTSRPIGATELGVPPTWAIAELAPFSDEQILDFAKRWFALSDANITSEEHLVEELTRAQAPADKFLQAVRASSRTHALARTPLLTRALADMYRRAPKLPEARADVYGDIVHLLLSRHPATRDRAADHDTRSELSSRELRSGISSLALALQSKKSVVLSSKECESFWASHLEDCEDGLGLERSAAKRIAATVTFELVSRYAVMVERAPGELGFVHLSIQEYLAAEAVAARPEVRQLEWIAEAWKDPSQRECVLSWIGINGQRGQRALVSNAVAAIKSGGVGPYLGARSLELRTEIACTDLGLSLPASREIIEEAAVQLRRSPFMSHRLKLASTLTVGALGSRVSGSCSEVIRKSMCARPGYTRAAGIRALAKWERSQDLQQALIDLLFDEDGDCGRAAAETIAAIYGEDVTVLDDVKQLARSDVRPEVRAAALRCLARSTAGLSFADEAARANEHATHPNLLIEVYGIYVRGGRQADAHLKKLLDIFEGGSIDYWQQEEFFDLLHQGWRGARAVRRALIDSLNGRSGSNPMGALNYLIRAYPQDEEIASLVVREVQTRGIGYSFPTEIKLSLLAEHFANNAAVVAAIREALREVEEKYPGAQWHPRFIGAYLLLADDITRDRLFTSYIESDRAMDRRWIATALREGWKSDSVVNAQFNKWLNGPVDLWLPLVPWLSDYIDDAKSRRERLEDAIRIGDPHGVPSAIHTYLREFPDGQACARVWERLAADDIWYYSRVDIEATLAGIEPSVARSMRVIERSVSELDGPSLAPWIASTSLSEHQQSVALAALRPAAAAVRMAIASTVAARASSYREVVDLVPGYLAEERGSVRSTVMLALADLSKSAIGEASKFREIALAEAHAIGGMMDTRRLTGVSCLLALGKADDLVSVVADIQSTRLGLGSALDPDPVAYACIAKHWSLWRSALQAANEDYRDLLGSIIRSGAIVNASDVSGLAEDVDAILAGEWDDWNLAAYASTYLLRRPQRDVVAHRLIEQVALAPGRRSQMVAAKLLAQNFGGDAQVFQQLKERLDASNAWSAYWYEGTLGHLVTGWPQDLRLTGKNLSASDAVLVHAALGDVESSKSAACNLLRDPYRNREFSTVEREVLRSWARAPGIADALLEWSRTDDATLSMTAVSLLVAGGHGNMLDRGGLLARLANEFASATPPKDGLNGATGELTGWAVSVYASLDV